MLVGAAVLAMTTSPAAAAPAAGGTVEELVVTGSRIQSPNLDSPTPVQVVGQDRLQAEGLHNLADVLQTLPQFAPSFGGSRTQSTFSGTTSSGLNLINLRNLGSSRSLVLINGRRAPSGTIFSNAVDMNLIPSANIKRIDVITGGASAVYGADAVSGVVNVITDTGFEGLEMGASYGMAIQHQDNINPSGFIRFGSSFDRGHVGATLQYDYQGLVSCKDRYLCSEDFFWSPPSAPIRGPSARSGVPLNGRFFVTGQPAGGGNASSYTFDNSGQLAPFSTALYGYNRNAQRTLAIPTERILFAADGDYKIVDGLNAFMELNYGSTDTNGPFEGHPFQSSTDLVAGLLEPSIPANNPFIPASLRAKLAASNNPNQDITWSQRLAGLGARGSQNLRQSTRLAVGLRGNQDSLFGFGKDWSYEASYVWGRTTLNGNTEGTVSREALYNGLRVQQVPGGPAGTYQCVDPLARAQGCVPINPFDGYNAAESAYLVRNTGVNSASELENGLAYLSGTLFDLPAGPLQVALGAESRRITAYEDYSTEINLGTVTGNQISDSTRTTFTTNEAFVEVKAPVVRDLPFVKELNVEGGYRWSDANVGGRYETWKFGGEWAPIDGLRFRAMKNRAVRAPVLGEVTGVGQTFGVVADPCINYQNSSNATLKANCAAAGVPTNYDPPITVQQSVSGFVGGNPNLKPEIADTLTYGVVIQAGRFDFMPSLLKELTVSVDRFDIKIDGLINTVGRQNLAQLCYERPTGQREVFCSQVFRGTRPEVPGATYVLTQVNDQLSNIATFQVRGVDLEVNYKLGLGDLVSDWDRWGSLSLNSVWTFYDKASEVPIPGESPIDLLGAAGGSTSDQGFLKRQGNTTIAWTVGDFRVQVIERYIGKAKSAPADIFGAENIVDIPAEWYSDVNLRWKATDQVEVYGGVNNLFDKNPPFFPSSESGTQALDTVPAYYDVFGRSIYAGVRLRF
ncbi:MAG: putative TonB-dependent receptor [Phenylobacterium sp.]|nr:putative TonB-dependent receptor [Phenylobacterium sp.]